MKKIPVEKIESGMVLAQDICSASGNALLGKGTQLTASLGRRLKNWGVPFVVIEGEEEQVNDKPSVEIQPEKIKQELETKFGELLKNPIMKDIFTAVYNFKTKKLS